MEEQTTQTPSLDDGLKKIYNKDVEWGYKGTFDQFSTFFNENDENKKKVYDFNVKNGYKGSYDDFISFAGTTAQPKQDPKKRKYPLPTTKVRDLDDSPASILSPTQLKIAREGVDEYASYFGDGFGFEVSNETWDKIHEDNGQQQKPLPTNQPAFRRDQRILQHEAALNRLAIENGIGADGFANLEDVGKAQQQIYDLTPQGKADIENIEKAQQLAYDDFTKAYLKNGSNERVKAYLKQNETARLLDEENKALAEEVEAWQANHGTEQQGRALAKRYSDFQKRRDQFLADTGKSEETQAQLNDEFNKWLENDGYYQALVRQYGQNMQDTMGDWTEAASMPIMMQMTKDKIAETRAKLDDHNLDLTYGQRQAMKRNVKDAEAWVRAAEKNGWLDRTFEGMQGKHPGFNIATMFRGMGNAANLDLLTFGISDAVRNMPIMRVAKKVRDEGVESLTPEEKALMESSETLQLTQSMFNIDQNAFNAGATTMEMIPFIAELWLSGGANAAVKAGVKGAMKGGAKGFGKGFKAGWKAGTAREAAQLGRYYETARFAPKSIGQVAKEVGMTAADIVDNGLFYALTTGSGHSVANTLQYMTPAMELGKDFNFNFNTGEFETKGARGGDKLGIAALKGFGEQVIEGGSEMVGEKLLQPLLDRGSYWLRGMMGKEGRAMYKPYLRVVDDWIGHGALKNVSGYGIEYGEELIGSAARAITGISSWDDEFNKDNLAQTAYGLMPAQVAFAILGGGRMVGHARRSGQARALVGMYAPEQAAFYDRVANASTYDGADILDRKTLEILQDIDGKQKDGTLTEQDQRSAAAQLAMIFTLQEQIYMDEASAYMANKEGRRIYNSITTNLNKDNGKFTVAEWTHDGTTERVPVLSTKDGKAEVRTSNGKKQAVDLKDLNIVGEYTPDQAAELVKRTDEWKDIAYKDQTTPIEGSVYYDADGNVPIVPQQGSVTVTDVAPNGDVTFATEEGKTQTMSQREFYEYMRALRDTNEETAGEIMAWRVESETYARSTADTDDPETHASAGRDERAARRALEKAVGETRMAELEQMNNDELTREFLMADANTRTLLMNWMEKRYNNGYTKEMSDRRQQVIQDFKDKIGITENENIAIANHDGNTVMVESDDGQQAVIVDMQGNKSFVDSNTITDKQASSVDDFATQATAPQLAQLQALQTAYEGLYFQPGQEYTIGTAYNVNENDVTEDTKKAIVVSINEDGTVSYATEYGFDKEGNPTPAARSVKKASLREFRNMVEGAEQQASANARGERLAQQQRNDMGNLRNGQQVVILHNGKLTQGTVMMPYTGSQSVIVEGGSVVSFDSMDDLKKSIQDAQNVINTEQQKAIEAVANRITELANAMSNASIKVVTDINELRPDAQEFAKQGRLEAYFDPGTNTVVFYAPGLVANNSNVDGKVIHEVVIHYGLKNMLGEKDYAALCLNIFNNVMDDNDRAQYVQYVKDTHPNWQTTLNDEQIMAMAADEWLAFTYENRDIDSIKRESLLQTIVNFIVDLFKKAGVDLNREEVMAELDQLVAASRDWLRGEQVNQEEKKEEAPKEEEKKEEPQPEEPKKSREELVANAVQAAYNFAAQGDTNFVKDNLDKAKKRVSNAKKRKPTSTDPAKRQEQIEKINTELAAAENELAFWNEVQAAIDQANLANQSRLNEADQALADLDKNLNPAVEAEEVHKFDKEPANADEAAADYLVGFVKKEHCINEQSLMQETGWSENEVKNFRPATTPDGGMTLQEAAEALYDEYEGEGHEHGWFSDPSDARDKLLSVMQSTGKYGELANYINNRRGNDAATQQMQAALDYNAQQLGYTDAQQMHDQRMAEAQAKLQELKDPQGNLSDEALQQFKDFTQGLMIGKEETTTEQPTESIEGEGEYYQPTNEEAPFSVVLPIDQQTPKNTTIDQVLYSIKVNHNSPYLLKKADGSFIDPETGERLGFDHRFMNTGEGNQAHGWGSYFSVNDLRTYGGQLGGNNVKYKGKDYYDSGLQPIALVELQLNDGNVEAARKELESRIEEAENLGEPYVGTWMLDNVPIRNAKIALEQLSNPKDFEFDRHHYNVEIPDNDGTNYIEEGEQLSQEELNRIGDSFVKYTKGELERKGKLDDRREKIIERGRKMITDSQSTGRDIYGYLEKTEGFGAETASKILNNAGFVGIHYNGYADGECYVIFDENDAKIVDHVMFSVVTPQQDADYMDAVNRGDMETAQRMVDEAAERAGYDTKAYHGTGSYGFTTFKERNEWNYDTDSVEGVGIFFSSDKNNSNGYEDTDVAEELGYENTKEGTYSVFLKLTNPLVVDYGGAWWNGRKFTYEIQDENGKQIMAFNSLEEANNFSENYNKENGASTKVENVEVFSNLKRNSKYITEAKQNGNDGVIFNNIKDSHIDNHTAKPATTYAVFSPSQIKSADPVTYDDQGNVIPLSERFNEGNDDIRYSVVSPESQAIFDKAKEIFGTTSNIKEAGYILPDGAMLDFSGRKDLDEGTDDGFLRGRRTEDHRDIQQIGYEKDGNTPSGVNTDMPDFIRRGAIRIDSNAGVINLAVKPTQQQRWPIRRIVETNDGDVQVDFGNGWDSDHYVEYDGAKPSRVLADIDRYFDEGIKPEGNLMFSVANANQAIFVSNAARAVEGIKQEKATPEQWLKMIEKNGGLKAGEDKWLGLSQWLKDSKAKTLTKQEVLDFINENAIKIEEEGYADASDNMTFEALKQNYDYMLREEGYDYAWEQLRKQFGDDADIAFTDIGGELEIANAEAAAALLGSETPINSTRIKYTTAGLDNKREIALTVPTIEPWNESDEVHFGDAGEGRAVAWIRFGETTTGGLENFHQQMLEKYGSTYMLDWTDEEQKQYNELRNKKKERVLVIDEIQSKRHQEGRERGYYSPEAREAYKEYKEYLRKKYPNGYLNPNITDEEIEANKNLWGKATKLTEEEQVKYSELKDKAGMTDGAAVPSAPFEKNWMELAMKRMLRLAAEEGYDKVAWTTGEQQAERYNLGKQVKDITASVAHDPMTGEVIEGEYEVFPHDHNNDVILQGEAAGRMDEAKVLAVYGKDLGSRIIEAAKENPEGTTLEGGDLMIGGEGMKGFYDKMIPLFMNKYGKQWGVKVGEVTMPNLEKGYQTMHSIDVNDAMKESVMGGQLMFSFVGRSGAQRLDMADRAMTRLNNLHVAREMEEQGKEAKAIKLATGWERGKDGQWRFEIPDYYHVETFLQNHRDEYKKKRNKLAQEENELYRKYNALDSRIPVYLGKKYSDEEKDKFRDMRKQRDKIWQDYLAKSKELQDLQTSAMDGITITLPEFIGEDNPLFTAYPKLKETKVVWKALRKGLGGSYNEDENSILINGLESDEEANQTLAHEIQHAIQGFEGFAQGGNPAYIAQAVKDMGGKARIWSYRQMLDDVAKQNGLGTDTSEDDMLAAVTGFLGMDETAATNEGWIPEKDLRRVAYNGWKKGSGMDDYKEAYDKWYDKMRETQNSKYWEGTPVQLYRRLAGETEARNVQTRLGFTEEQRRAILAQDTEDVAREEQLVMFAGDPVLYSVARNANTPKERMEMYDALVKSKLSQSTSTSDFMGRTLNGAYQSIFDGAIAIKRLQTVIGGKNGVKDAENAYLMEIARASRAKYLTDQAEQKYMQPMMDAIAALTGKQNRRGFYKAMRDVELYVLAKSGLERNKWFWDEAKKNDPNAQLEDKSGLTALAAQFGATDFTAFAERLVSDYESRHGKDKIDNLWNTIRNMSHNILDTEADGLLISADLADNLKKRWQYYVPMRGFDEPVTSSIYSYDPSSANIRFENPFKKIKGRVSLADNPFVNLWRMTESAINMKGKNEIGLALLTLASNHSDNGLLRVGQSWETKVIDSNGNETWQMAYPDLSKMAQADIPRAIDAFQKEMLRKAKTGDARPSSRTAGGMRIYPKDYDQHTLKVTVGGQTVDLYLLGNPAAFQALNPTGKTEWMQNLSALTRGLSGLMTTYNPVFMVRNSIRDLGTAMIITYTRDGLGGMANMTGQWFGNAGKLHKLIRGKSSGDATIDRYWQEFLEFGGETGFTRSLAMEKSREKFMKDMRNATRKGINPGTVLHAYGDWMENYGNRFAEDITRFAVFCASRKRGKSAMQAAADAKNTTANFNKKGQSAFARFMTSNFAFFNAALQGLNTTMHAYKDNPGRALAASAFTAAFSMAVPYINMILLAAYGDDDDWLQFENMTQFTGNTHLVIFMGKGFLTLPYPQDFVPLTALGNIIFRNAAGMTNLGSSDNSIGKNIMLEWASTVADLLPVNMFEEGFGKMTDWKGVARALAPTWLSPVADIMLNRNYMGSEIRHAHWTNNGQKDIKPYWAEYDREKNWWAYDIAKRMAGGDEYRAAAAWRNVDPRQIIHLVEGYGGGTVKFISDALVYGKEKMAGEHPSINQSPFVKKFWIQPQPEKYEGNMNGKLYEMRNHQREMEQDLKALNKELQQALADGNEKAAEQRRKRIDEIQNSVDWQILKDYDLDAMTKEWREQRNAITANEELSESGRQDAVRNLTYEKASFLDGIWEAYFVNGEKSNWFSNFYHEKRDKGE